MRAYRRLHACDNKSISLPRYHNDLSLVAPSANLTGSDPFQSRHVLVGEQSVVFGGGVSGYIAGLIQVAYRRLLVLFVSYRNTNPPVAQPSNDSPYSEKLHQAGSSVCRYRSSRCRLSSQGCSVSKCDIVFHIRFALRRK